MDRRGGGAVKGSSQEQNILLLIVSLVFFFFFFFSCWRDQTCVLAHLIYFKHRKVFTKAFHTPGVIKGLQVFFFMDNRYRGLYDVEAEKLSHYERGKRSTEQDFDTYQGSFFFFFFFKHRIRFVTGRIKQTELGISFV